jgi:hypothetical protein
MCLFATAVFSFESLGYQKTEDSVMASDTIPLIPGDNDYAMCAPRTHRQTLVNTTLMQWVNEPIFISTWKETIGPNSNGTKKKIRNQLLLRLKNRGGRYLIYEKVSRSWNICSDEAIVQEHFTKFMTNQMFGVQTAGPVVTATSNNDPQYVSAPHVPIIGLTQPTRADDVPSIFTTDAESTDADQIEQVQDTRYNSDLHDDYRTVSSFIDDSLRPECEPLSHEPIESIASPDGKRKFCGDESSTSTVAAQSTYLTTPEKSSIAFPYKPDGTAGSITISSRLFSNKNSSTITLDSSPPESGRRSKYVKEKIAGSTLFVYPFSFPIDDQVVENASEGLLEASICLGNLGLSTNGQTFVPRFTNIHKRHFVTVLESDNERIIDTSRYLSDNFVDFWMQWCVL